MTYDSQVATTYGQMAQELRDKITSVTGYSVVEDTVGSDIADGDYWVIETPDGEHFKVQFQFGNYADLKITYGVYDTGSSSFTTTYLSNGAYFDNGNNAIDSNTSFEYWLERVPRGFAFWAKRVEGDGGDSSIFFSLERLNELWDYKSGENTDESHAVVSYGSSTNNWDLRKQTRQGSNYEGGYGLLNPDNAYSDYLWQEATVHSTRYQNADTNESAPIGTCNLVLEDQSGSLLDSGDVIQDNSSNDIYEVLKWNNAPAVVFRME